MKCNVCDRCGCNLDFGETCDCERGTEKENHSGAPLNEQKERATNNDD